MATQLQFRRGNTAQTATFTGAVSELTVDTSKNTIVVHDGSTPGGHPLSKESFTQDAYNKANAAFLAANTDYDTLANTLSSNVQFIAAINATQNTEIQSKVSKAGDTMTGTLNLTNASASGNISVTGNISASYINLTQDLEANNLIVNHTLYSGLATRSATPLPNLIAQFTGNTNSYVQVNVQNIDQNGSADYVATADVGTDTTFYIDLGIQNSEQDFGNIKRLDGYLYVQGNTGQLGGNLVIGTASGTAGQQIRFVSGGLEDDNVFAVLETSTSYFKNNVVVDGTISGPTITSMQNRTQAAFNAANSAASNAAVVFSHANAAFLQANTPSHVANSASVYANGAFEQANAAFLQANTPSHVANSASIYANGAFVQANAAFLEANTPSHVANSASVYANGAFLQANTPSHVANSAAIYANGAFEQANAAFITANTPTHVANSAAIYANGAFNQANAAYSSQNVTGSYANSAYDQANSAYSAASNAYNFVTSVNVYSYAAFAHANASFDQANAAFNTANSATSNAAAASSYANSAFNTANSKFNTSGGTITGDVSITGNTTPTTDNVYTLGTATNRWKSIYVGPGSVYVGNTVLSETGNVLVISGVTDIVLPNSNLPATTIVSDTANSASNYANGAFAQANAAFAAANNVAPQVAPAFNTANAAFVHANSAYESQNTTGTYANSAFSTANSAGNYANSAFNQANTATTNAATADSKAITAGQYANSAYNQANTATTNAATADSKAVTAGQYANSAFDVANSASSYANGAFAQANAAFNKANTSVQTSGINSITSGSLSITNTGGIGLSVTGNVIFNNDLSVSGNIYLGGNATTFGANNITLEDSLIYLANNNSGNTVDIGIVANFNYGYYQHTGVVRDATDGTWKFFSNVVAEPTTTVDFTNAIYEPIRVGEVVADVAKINGTNLLPYTQAAFGHANAAYASQNTTGSYANSAYNQANTATTNAATADSKAVTAGQYANSAYNQANTATTNAATADSKAVTAGSYANSAYNQANTATTNAATADSKAVTAGSYANSAFGVANSASTYANGAFVQANAAFNTANSATSNAAAASSYANSAYNQANTATTNAATADSKAVTAGSYANSSFGVANSAAIYANGAFTQANAAFNKANNALANTTGTFNGSLSVTGTFTSLQSSGDEGGQIDLAKAATNTTLTTGVSIDVFQNRVRIFETGGTNRGLFIDIANNTSSSVGTNLLNPSSLSVNTDGNISASSFTTTASVAQVTVDSFSTSSFRSAKYVAQMTAGTSYHVIELRVVHDGTTVWLAQYGEIFTGSSLGTFDASITTGTLNLQFTPASATVTTIKVLRTTLAV